MACSCVAASRSPNALNQRSASPAVRISLPALDVALRSVVTPPRSSAPGCPRTLVCPGRVLALGPGLDQVQGEITRRLLSPLRVSQSLDEIAGTIDAVSVKIGPLDALRLVSLNRRNFVVEDVFRAVFGAVFGAGGGRPGDLRRLGRRAG